MAITTFTDLATVDAATTDSNPADNTDGATVDVVRLADLQVVKTANPATVTPGGTTTYSLVVHNNGPSDAEGVQLVDQPDSSLTLLGATGATCDASGVGGLSCTIGLLRAGGSVAVTVTAQLDPSAAPSSVASNVVEVSADTDDPVSSNNKATASVTVGPYVADLQVAKSVDPPSVVAGGRVVYTVTVTNAGPSTCPTWCSATSCRLGSSPPTVFEPGYVHRWCDRRVHHRVGAGRGAATGRHRGADRLLTWPGPALQHGDGDGWHDRPQPGQRHGIDRPDRDGPPICRS